MALSIPFSFSGGGGLLGKSPSQLCSYISILPYVQGQSPAPSLSFDFILVLRIIPGS